MTETMAPRMDSSRKGLWGSEAPSPANVRVSGKECFVACFAIRSKRCLVFIFIEELLTLQSSLESQTQQARNDDIMKASPRLFSVLSSFCYFLEAVAGQNHLIHWESGAAWRKSPVKFKQTLKSITKRSTWGQVDSWWPQTRLSIKWL